MPVASSDISVEDQMQDIDAVSMKISPRQKEHGREDFEFSLK